MMIGRTDLTTPPFNSISGLNSQFSGSAQLCCLLIISWYATGQSLCSKTDDDNDRYTHLVRHSRFHSPAHIGDPDQRLVRQLYDSFLIHLRRVSPSPALTKRIDWTHLFNGPYPVLKHHSVPMLDY